MITYTLSKRLLKLSNLMLLTVLFTGLILMSCEEDEGTDPMNEPTGDMKEFMLQAVSDPSINGNVTFEELEGGETKVTIDLSGTSSGNSHPAHIHMNTAAESGDIAVSLNPVDGETGMSETIVSALDDGTSISYDQLINFDGYVNVHLSTESLATLVAQGDIGQNALTGESVVYPLGSVSDPSINGEALFEERMNGETLVTLMLDGTSDGGEHPAHIHINTAAEGGDIAITLTRVDGATGWSKTNVSTLDGGTSSVTYTDLIEFDGYINVHLSTESLATLVAQGDIGQNALTGESESYTLNEKAVAGISGTATFHERVNSETLIIVELSGSVSGDHPMHIHAGSVAEAPGDILITLSDVNSEGISKTNVAENDNMDMVSYDNLVSIDGYINVHSSLEDLATLIAQGNVGANVD